MHPAAKSELPEGAVCALTPDGLLSVADRWHVGRFRTLLGERKEIKERYAAEIGALPPGDPRRACLAKRRSEEIRALLEAYDAECEHVNSVGGP